MMNSSNSNTTTVNLYAASKQWAERPADQRFESLDAMFDACKHYAEAARTARVLMNSLRVQTNDSQTDLLLAGPAGNPATLTHWSFGQLCNRVAAPAGYLRALPAPIAAECLTHGLRQHGAVRYHREFKGATTERRIAEPTTNPPDWLLRFSEAERHLDMIVGLPTGPTMERSRQKILDRVDHQFATLVSAVLREFPETVS